MPTSRLYELAPSLTTLVLVLVSAGIFSLGATRPAPADAHRVAPFPRRTALAGSPSHPLYRVPAEFPGDVVTLSVAPTETLSPTQRELVKLRALHLAPPRYLLDQGITRVPRRGRRVALTFDDGPSKNTSEVLSILDRHDAEATFFFVGKRCVGRPDTLRAVLDQGSEIGNHTWDHVSLLGQSKEWDVEQIQLAERIYFEYAGVRPRWVRPQSGWLDQTGIDAIESLDKRYVYWDDFGNDTVKRFTAEDIASSVLSRARSGSVILLHETNPRTIEALPRILRGLKRRGYEVTTLTRAMGE